MKVIARPRANLMKVLRGHERIYLSNVIARSILYLLKVVSRSQSYLKVIARLRA